MTPEKETLTRKFVGLDEKGYETSEPTQYVEVLEGETPTLKGVEEVVAEFKKQRGMSHLRYDYPEGFEDDVKWLRSALLARDAAHEARLRGVLKEILEEQTTFDNYNNTQTYAGVLVADIRRIAKEHGITNL